ncbi:MAG: GIY-YIG nuclease family protein [Candidatus Diapherotrites archaeon]|uniref:GIY-YIG nuclease family protein n=1 Tax=Candidatus Iainarchaeum sp. TaxID=3101447 RepID=A0A939C669_9ARCH|nr:GIY-YIG nuclease family protein [Candidatus Diapherotrites archaeon]
MFSVYLLQCRGKSLYCGYAKDIKARLELHKKGKASRYTRSRLPVKLVFVQRKKTRKEAMKREAEIKKMPRKEKLNLIRKS